MPSLVEQQTAVEQAEQAAGRRLPVIAVETLGSIAVLALIGALSVWANEPWLVASLGPSVLMQTLSPEQKVASMWDTCAGQLVGLGVGFAGVYAVGAESVPALASGDPLTWARVAAVAVAFVLLIPLQHALKAKHPPAGSTALLVALGIEPPSWHTAWVMIVGIIMITVFGEGARIATLRVKEGPAATAKVLSQKP